ncbi:putative glycosyltransferase [Sphingomonas sp. SORGH_AS 950]|uniref:glycosyltransferase n=1 Tax=Sphingomonas sp. SORGH_AS_0950 TaxID=3041792 RepID=UPI00277E37F0|nr:glycosyltransferase [Sphingomonas sp. SORGH_AS_0950]MDQ1159618.1 putative glycosyltransferase [Sphingomonas sp. SORGH_AS_0950]
MKLERDGSSPQSTKIAQRRAIFFVFDGGVGLGHLRRLCRIAERMQGPFSCLIVTGHRDAATWFVPETCEYVHLPAWDGLIEERARYWSRKPFLEVSVKEAVSIRRTMIAGIMNAFRPDVIFVDHLPLGARDELADVIEGAPGLKYLVTRGVLNETEDLDALIFGGRAGAALAMKYDRIFVAADRRIVQFGEGRDLPAEVRAKIVETGYVARPISGCAIAERRAARGLHGNDVWVVASAGGGQTGEETIRASVALVKDYPKFAFDIVIGPRSNLRLDNRELAAKYGSRVRIHRTANDMSMLHAAADIVITAGGYNSILETIQGDAALICVPLRRSELDEQIKHARKLSEFIDIRVASTVAELPGEFAKSLAGRSKPTRDRRGEIDMSGAEVIANIAMSDLALLPASSNARS